MAKRNPQLPEQTYVEPQLTNEELRALDTEVIAAGGRFKWLEKKGAVRLDEHDHIVAVKDYGKNGEHDFPYVHLSNKLTQLDAYRARVQYAKDKEVEQLTGQKPIHPAFEEAKKKAREVLGNMTRITG